MPANILVVEDDPLVAMGIQLVLEEEGYEVLLAASGEAAVHAVAARTPSMVLMDVNLNGAMGGIEAAELISSGFALPVIFVTAQTDAATYKKAMAARPRGFLKKPFTPNQLLNAVQTVSKTPSRD